MNNAWKTASLGEVFTTVTGNTPPTSNAQFYGEYMPFVKPPELRDSEVDSAADSLSETGAAVARTLPPQSVLVSCIGNLGKVGLNVIPVAFNQQINAILPDEGKALPRFMFYQALSNSFKEQLENFASGTTVPIVNKSRFNSIQIVLPPLPEQQRIVGILDEAFEGIAKAKANAESNLKNARALLDTELRTIFTIRGPEWVEKPLESVCTLFVDSAHRTPNYQENGIPALRPRDVVNGKLNLAGCAKVSQEEYEIQSKRHRPAVGDVVYSRELSYGWAVMLPESPRVCLSQGMCLFRSATVLDTKFLLYVLNGPVGRTQASRVAVGAAHPHINLGDIKAYSIPYPPLDEQQRIVRQLDGIAAQVEQLDAIYRHKLSLLGTLKQSLLHHTFTGQL